MLESIAIFLVFLYFKIARVHKKEEFLSQKVIAMHIVAGVGAFLIFAYAFNHNSSFLVLIEGFLSFIIAALLITAVQVGIFVDGKPLLKMSHIYKIMPFLAGVILSLAILLWLF